VTTLAAPTWLARYTSFCYVYYDGALDGYTLEGNQAGTGETIDLKGSVEIHTFCIIVKGGLITF
jgi:hypothetical protein